MRFLFSVNVYAFIPIVLFLWLKIAKNCQKWVYMGMGKIFYLKLKKIVRKSSKIHCFSCLPRTKQPDSFLLTVFESNGHGWSFPVVLGLRWQDC